MTAPLFTMQKLVLCVVITLALFVGCTQAANSDFYDVEVLRADAAAFDEGTSSADPTEKLE